MSASLGRLWGLAVVLGASVGWSQAAHAQNFRFTLRAEPNVIAANGISTTSILVQVPSNERNSISSTQIVRFATTAGVIESQAQLSGGVARVLLRSSTTPGTAVITAFVGASREATTVEFSDDDGITQRYLEVAAPYVAYGADESVITAAGKTALDFGDLHIQSDVRLDVDLNQERVWAQGNRGGITIRYGMGAKAKELHGDRLFYDLRRRQGVIRRADGDATATSTGARQEFVGANFDAPPEPAKDAEPTTPALGAPADAPSLSPSPRVALQTDKEAGSRFVVPVAPPTAPLQARDGVEVAPGAPPPTTPANPNAAAPPNEQGNAPDAKAPGAAPEGETPGADAPDANAPEDKAPDATVPDAKTEEGAPVEGPTTAVPGSPAAPPQPPTGQETRVNPLVTVPRTGEDGKEGAPAIGSGPAVLPDLTPYVPLPDNKDFEPRIIELPPPTFDTNRGYWVTARHLRVFPRDKVQFERASIYFNGGKAFGAPLYVLPLDGSFNPTTDMFAFNSVGGLSMKVPFTYMASRNGTGSISLLRQPGAGFGTQQSGFSLALNQDYFLSPRSSGKFSVDQIGNGPFNVNYQHLQQLDAKTNMAFYVNMPEHRDMYLRSALTRDFSKFQLGLESFYDRPSDAQQNLRGQFYARMRPRSLGKSGWSVSSGVNFLAVQNSPYSVTTEVSSGGGFGGTRTTTTQSELRYRRTFGQTINTSLMSPAYTPWRGAQFSATLNATGFNYSDGRRGFAPGVTMGLAQNLGKANLRFDYNYDRSTFGLYGSSTNSFTHYVSSSLGVQVASNIGFSSFLSKSLQDDSIYGSADLSYYFMPHWRAGFFTDYQRFDLTDTTVNYGMSVGRSIGGRDVTVNWDALRRKFYFEIGQGNY